MAAIRRGWPIVGAGLRWRGVACAVLMACARGEGHAFNDRDAGGDATAGADVARRPSDGAWTSPDGSANAGATAGASFGEGGAAGCRVLGGPFELPGGGSPALVARGDILLAVANEDGRPGVTAFRAGQWA